MVINQNNVPSLVNYKQLSSELDRCKKKYCEDQYKEILKQTFFRLAYRAYVNMNDQEAEFARFMKRSPDVSAFEGIVRVAFGALYEYAIIYYAKMYGIVADYNNSAGNYIDLTSSAKDQKVFDVKFQHRKRNIFAGADIKCCTDFRSDDAFYNIAFTHSKIKEMAYFHLQNPQLFNNKSYLISFVPTKSYKVLTGKNYWGNDLFFKSDMLTNNINDLIYIIDLTKLVQMYQQNFYNFNQPINNVNFIINTRLKNYRNDDIYGFRYNSSAIIKFTDFINALK